MVWEVKLLYQITLGPKKMIMANHYLAILSHFQILILILVNMKNLEIKKKVYLKAVGYDCVGTLLSYVKIFIVVITKNIKYLVKRKTF